MAVSIPFTGKPDVSGTGDFPAYSPKISSDSVGEGNLNRAIFKSDAHRISEFFFGALCEIDAFDAVCAKALRCAFGKLPS